MAKKANNAKRGRPVGDRFYLRVISADSGRPVTEWVRVPRTAVMLGVRLEVRVRRGS